MPSIPASLALVLLSLAVAACGRNDNDPGPGGVTIGEARALDEAAEMIEQRRLPPEALRPTGTASADPAGEAP